MIKIMLIVPDGVAVRNYLYSSFIKQLQKNGLDIIIYHQLSDSAISEIKVAQPGLKEFKEIPKFRENIIIRILRESIAFGRLRYNSKKMKNQTIMHFWNRNYSSVKSTFLYVISEIFGNVLSLDYKFILKFEAIYEKLILKDLICNQIYTDIELWKPDCILNLHQRSPNSAPIISAAKLKNIKTATVIFSWDNIPKARLISRYDKYLVWSELMKNDLLLLYPEVKESNIHVVGTPQFEIYSDLKYILSKEVFFYKYGLDTSKKTVCFSGNDESSLYDPVYLSDICNAILQIKESERPQLIFRRCPVDRSKRFDKIVEKYKELITVIDPDWKSDGYGINDFISIYPTINDNLLLVNTVKHSDLVINLGSTMAHDFAVYNKPCLYLNYNPKGSLKDYVRRIYDFQHFRSIEDLDAVGWINSEVEISDKILQCIHTPERIGKDRLVWMNKIVLYPLENNSYNIVQALLN
jgi:hypothetical protein